MDDQHPTPETASETAANLSTASPDQTVDVTIEESLDQSANTPAEALLSAANDEDELGFVLGYN